MPTNYSPIPSAIDTVSDTTPKATVKWLDGMSPAIRIAVVAFIVGLLTGLTASALKWTIEAITTTLAGHPHSKGLDWKMLYLPVVGILLAGLYQRHVLRRDISHGADKVTDFVRAGKSKIAPLMIYAPFIASSITLGFGGSAGAEGPVATSGSAIGSNIARKLGLSDDEIRMMVCIGAGAGIAGIFKAPIGGALFTLEIMAVNMNAPSVIALIVATLTSALTAFTFSGFAPDIAFPDLQSVTVASALWSIGMGVLCGFYSCYYSIIMEKLRNFYDKFNRQWLKNIIAGGVIGIGVLCFPSLYGEGYGVISKMLAGDPGAFLTHSILWAKFGSASMVIVMTGCVVLYKVFATASTNCGGGVAGDFAPTLFAGAVAGYLFAMLVKWIGYDLPVADCVMLGMAGVMAGAVKAPLMATFLTMEMAMSFRLFLPAAIAAAVSYWVRILLRNELRIFKKEI